MKTRIVIHTLIVVVVLVCTGCASIVDGRRKAVHLNSNPPGAQVTVFNKKGESIIVTNTPAIVRLKRNTGYFSGETYKLSFSAPGYYPSEVTVKANLNGWYFGNLVFGGLIGMVFVDPATGAMWTLAPKNIERNLVATTANLSPEQLKIAELEANPLKKQAAPIEKSTATRY
jgi:hypothetical protein